MPVLTTNTILFLSSESSSKAKDVQESQRKNHISMPRLSRPRRRHTKVTTLKPGKAGPELLGKLKDVEMYTVNKKQ